MTTQTLTTDFTEEQLKNYHLHYLVEAKQRCSDKITFHQSEINNGHCSQYHLDQLDLYFNEFCKWVPIIQARKAKDAKDEADYWGTCLHG